MDVALFHLKLLGARPEENFRLTPQHRWLYNGFAKSGLRGYSGNEANETRFLATLVLALYQVKTPEETEMHRVALILPKPLTHWYREQVKAIATYVFSKRQGQTEACRVITDAFAHLLRTSQVLQIRQPDRWVIFGFQSDDPLPPWVQGHLL